MTKRESAGKYFLAGYNCAQAVLCAFCDELCLTREQAAAMASPFGGGMGRLREVCGTVTGMFLVTGLLRGYDGVETGEVKAAHYARIQALAKEFERQNGSIVCRELLGLDRRETGGEPCARTADYYKKRPCALLCADAARILDEYLQKKE